MSFVPCVVDECEMSWFKMCDVDSSSPEIPSA